MGVTRDTKIRTSAKPPSEARGELGKESRPDHQELGEGIHMDDNSRGRKRARAVPQEDGVLLYEGGKVAEERKKEITRVRIGPQVKDIPRRTFDGCKNLAEVQFDEGALQVIGNYAFRDCTTLQQVTIPPFVTELGLGAFWGCVNLTDVQLKKGLQIIGGHAFRGCKALQQVTIPPSVTKLYACAFQGCRNLAEVQLKEGELQVIDDSSFYDCRALRGVTVPSSVTKLGQYAFSRCANLTEVILMGGEMLLNQRFLDRGLFSREGALDKERLNETIGLRAFASCP